MANKKTAENAKASEERRLASRRLQQAVEKRDADAVQLALSQGGDPNARLYGDASMPMLMLAVMDQHETIARLLLEAGADPNAVYRSSGQRSGPRSVLCLACESAASESARIIKMLCEFGALPGHSIDHYSDSPIVYSITANRKHAVRAMILAGYDFRAPLTDKKSKDKLLSAFEEAEKQQKLEIGDIMLAAEAEMEGQEIALAMKPGKAADPSSALRRPRV